MIKYKVKYFLPSHGQTADDAFELNVPIYSEQEWIAQKAADDYHSNHDGWEAAS